MDSFRYNNDELYINSVMFEFSAYSRLSNFSRALSSDRNQIVIESYLLTNLYCTVKINNVSVYNYPIAETDRRSFATRNVITTAIIHYTKKKKY